VEEEANYSEDDDEPSEAQLNDDPFAWEFQKVQAALLESVNPILFVFIAFQFLFLFSALGEDSQSKLRIFR